MIKKNPQLRIAFLSFSEIDKLRSQYGQLEYYLATSLNKIGDLDFISPPRTIEHSLYYRTKRRIYRYIFKKRFLPNRSKGFLKHVARQIDKLISRGSYDLIFSMDSIIVSHIETKIPIVFYTDAVFDIMIDFYPEFSNLCKESIIDGHNQEQAALDRALLAIYSSEWAVEGTVKNYKVDPNKVVCVPFGTYLSGIPERSMVTKPKNMEICNLLFIGFDWERKGGRIAVETVNELNRLGLKSKLYICGQFPDQGFLNDFVECKGLLHRDNAQDNAELESLFLRSHYLILPTRADCTPIIFGDAAAFGLPVITTDVGGIATTVANGVTGLLLSKEAGPEEYARVILDNFTNKERYRTFCLNSRERFEKVLNWDTSMARVGELILERLGFPERPFREIDQA